jgi:hypothetical protein
VCQLGEIFFGLLEAFHFEADVIEALAHAHVRVVVGRLDEQTNLAVA